MSYWAPWYRDKFNWLIISIFVLFVAGMVVLLYWGVQSDRKDRAECVSGGGVVHDIRNGRGWLCLPPGPAELT